MGGGGAQHIGSSKLHVVIEPAKIAALCRLSCTTALVMYACGGSVHTLAQVIDIDFRPEVHLARMNPVPLRPGDKYVGVHRTRAILMHTYLLRYSVPACL